MAAQQFVHLWEHNMSPDILERFWSKVDKTGDCWLWQASLTEKGYGRFVGGGKLYRAHRFVAEFIKNEDMSLQVLHTCDNPSCVNPDHLFMGTTQDNTKDMLAKNRSAKGETHSQQKLTEKQVKEIRHLRSKGKSLAHVAKMYNVSQGLISLVANRKIWSHV